jgi:hypothetical protein
MHFGHLITYKFKMSRLFYFWGSFFVLVVCLSGCIRSDVGGTANNDFCNPKPLKPGLNRVGNMQRARYGHQSYVLNNGNVLIIGGLAFPEIYKESKQCFEPLIKAGNCGSSCNMLFMSKKVVLIDEYKLLYLDPYTGNFYQPSIEMLIKRNGFQAIKLSDTKVLIVGGFKYGDNGKQIPVLATEILDISKNKFYIGPSLLNTKLQYKSTR